MLQKIKDAAQIQKIHSISTEELVEKLNKYLYLTLESLNELVVVWKELEYREYDLTSYKKGILEFMPILAKGHLCPDAIIKLGSRKTFLNMLAQLPMSLQKEILSKKISLAVKKNNGTIEVISLYVEQIPSNQIKVIFDLPQKRIRSIDEQKRLILKGAPKSAGTVNSASLSLPIDGILYKKIKDKAYAQQIPITQFVRSVLLDFFEAEEKRIKINKLTGAS